MFKEVRIVVIVIIVIIVVNIEVIVLHVGRSTARMRET